MEEDNRKPAVYLDLEEKEKRGPAARPVWIPVRPEESTLQERFAFWMDLIDR